MHPKIVLCGPSIHIWRYSPFQALASLIRRLHSSLFSALLLQPLIPSSCNASLWTTSAHLVLGLPTGLVVWKFPFKTFFGILSSSIFIMWPAHTNLLILMSSTMSGSLYKLYSSLLRLGLDAGMTVTNRMTVLMVRSQGNHTRQNDTLSLYAGVRCGMIKMVRKCKSVS